MAAPSNSFVLEDYVMHHVANSNQWNIPFLGHIPIPPFITLHGLMLIIWTVLMTVLFCVVYKKTARVPQGITNFLEMIVVFIRDEVAVPSLGKEDGRKMTPIFLTFFFFILGLNLLGLIPLFSTATSNINVTGALAVVTLAIMIGGAIYKHGLVGFAKSFIPHGIPVPVLIILVPLEFLGMFIKAFALMIRLFANMLAGHIVILSIVGLVGIFGWVALPSVFLAIFVACLEVFIAFLQAYVFTLLSAMFIGQMLHPQH
jgi:F-type H+-transporting ATPase subunit a